MIEGTNNKELIGTIALVTGGSKGVGRGITLGLAEHGATIYITSNSESPRFIGRVIAKLYSDPLRKLRSGKVCIAAALAKEYNVEDIDGKRPEPLTIEKV